MKILKGSTKAGQQIIAKGEAWEGNTLYQVYDRWSSDKQDAFDRCYNDYLNTEEHSAFGICSHNAWMFSVSWLGLYNKENALFYRTNKNDYIVLLDK